MTLILIPVVVVLIYSSSYAVWRAAVAKSNPRASDSSPSNSLPETIIESDFYWLCGCLGIFSSCSSRLEPRHWQETCSKTLQTRNQCIAQVGLSLLPYHGRSTGNRHYCKISKDTKYQHMRQPDTRVNNCVSVCAAHTTRRRS